MLKRIPLSIRLVTLTLAGLLGILPGIGIMQPNWMFVTSLGGWLSLPYYFYGVVTNSLPNDPVSQLAYQTTLNYPLAMLAYGLCTYWTIRTTRSIWEGATVMVAAIYVSTIASIPSAIITYCMMHEPHAFFQALLSIAPFYLSMLPIHGFILVNLFISALFGWLLAVGLTRRFRRIPHADAGNALENSDMWEEVPTRTL